MADDHQKEVSNEDRDFVDEEPASIIDLLRDVGQFQFKLIADSLRDLFLSPISIILALVGIVTRPDDPAYLFRQLLRFGVRSDRWINLFNSHDPREGGEVTSDQLLRDVETRVIEEWKRKQQREEDKSKRNQPKQD